MDFFESMDSTQKVVFGLALVTLLIAIFIFFGKSKGRNTNEGMRAQQMPPSTNGQGESAPPPMQAPTTQISTESTSSGGQKMLVLFFAPWCGHCKSLEPIWHELTQNFDGYNGVKIVKVNGDDAQNAQLIQTHGVQGFPSIKFCPRGVENGEGEVYQGPRDLQNLASFLQRSA